MIFPNQIFPDTKGDIPSHRVESCLLGVVFVSDSRKSESNEDLRLNPQHRLCPKFDPTSIAEFPVAPREKMGIRVLDNCAEEHIM